MQITDYIIDIKDSSLQDRLRLRQVLLDNDQKIWKHSKVFTTKYDRIYYPIIKYNQENWGGDDFNANISLQDFITKFKVQDQIRNLAIYKRSSEPWTSDEVRTIKDFVGIYEGVYSASSSKWIFDDGSECIIFMYYWDTYLTDNFNNCIQLAYEDLFPQEQSMSQNPFKTGDKVRSISNDNPTDRPYGSEHTVFKICGRDVSYWDGYAADYTKFELVQPTEPEIKYPLFKQHFTSYELIKYTDLTTGITLHKERSMNKAGYESTAFLPHTDKRFEHCDFTIEPEIFDIDWWDYRFKAGLPIWYTIGNNPQSVECVWLPSEYHKAWSDRKFYTSNPSCQDTIEANQLIQKEDQMNNTTLKLLLELLGASEEVKDATNSQFVGILTENGSYVGYIYCDSKEEAVTVMQQPVNELRKLHLFEKSCTLAQKPRKVIEIA